ncbi:MAG: DNA polymerase III subunit gamma/tau [Inquilinaceae bacterium]
MTDPTSPPADEPAGARPVYRVLARKYRPMTFAEMIGQDALVRTLTNAIAAGRLGHAFILTGVRGVGKTSSARIIARALNCVGPDGQGGPTASPCGVCDPCRAIAADRHVDVMEMDAASRTGVDDIRDIIDGVRYGPVSARFKVYIIDEVHMLSKNAFNALLKTLEEPPPHVKFLFATTEIRKVPVTVLSRCQRFDLRRIDSGTLATYFADIAAREEVTAEPEAIALIARAADGSARDGLSLLDQAIALGAGTVTAGLVRDMLGLADRGRIIDLFEAAITGDAAAALDRLAQLHRDGADPLAILHDLLDFTHTLTRLRLVPDAADTATMPEAERVRGRDLAGQLSMPVLTRCWQMLLKGVTEVQTAPVAAAALEMVLIRLIHAAGLPTPGDVIRRLESQTQDGAPSPKAAAEGVGGTTAPAPVSARGGSGAMPAMQPRPQAEAGRAVPAGRPAPASFRELVSLFEGHPDPLLHGHLFSGVHVVRFEPGRLEFRPKDTVPQNLASQIMTLLQDWTGDRWMVSVSREPGAPTLSEQDRLVESEALGAATQHPTVSAILDAFPGAMVKAIHDLPPPSDQMDPDQPEPDHMDDSPSDESAGETFIP